MYSNNIYVDLKEVEENLKLWGYECLDEVYYNAKTKLMLLDKEGYKYYATYDSLKASSGKARFVGNKNIYSIENIKLWLRKNNKPYDLISSEFNNKIKLNLYCNIHKCHFSIKWNNLQQDQHCPKCGDEIRIGKINRLVLKEVKLKVGNKIPTVKVISEKWTNSTTKIDCECLVCNNKFSSLYSNLLKGQGCPNCGLRKGESNGVWKGGITPLHTNMRTRMLKWRLDSYQKYEYKCDITGVKKKSNVIHHLYNYSDILQETLNVLNIKTKQVIGDYSYEELKIVEDKCLELHYKYGLGVCLSEEVHKEFHAIYGKRNNTLEQYLEFKENKLKGRYITNER